jgi:hypothetical protein
MNDLGTTLGASAVADEPAIHGSVQGSLLAQGEGVGEITWLRGITLNAGGRRRLTASAKYRIELEANRAAKDGVSRRDACRWPYASLEGEHWLASFLIAGGRV